jgi:glucose/arabinose dehydrogenase
MALGTFRCMALALALPGVTTAQKTQLLKSSDYTLQVTELNAELKSPWGMAFLPDGRLLVSQKSGSIALLSRDGRRIEQTITGLPRTASQGQGGLLDVILDPEFATTSWLYWSYAEPGEGGLSGTAVARAKLINGRLQATEIIYRQIPKVESAGHFGSRLVFGRDKSLFITLGDRQKFTPAQDMKQSIGKVVRIQRDGRIPVDNPKWKATGVRPEIYSLGHRNPQGAALHPDTGVLWLSEHGPQGGDEINRIRAGGNYGWPNASYGCHYGEPVGEDCRLGGGKHAPRYIEPNSAWGPRSIAPSGMLFYTGAEFPQWRNQVLMGALAGAALWRVRFDDDKEIRRERLLGDLGERIRDVEQGPDGSVYLLSDSGKLLKISRLPDRP